MKTPKLKLEELRVQSFVTEFDKEQNQTQHIQGGGLIAVNTVNNLNTVNINTDLLAKTCQACTHHCGFDTVYDNPIRY